MKIYNIDEITIGVDSFTSEEMALPVREREKAAVLRIINELTGFSIDELAHYADGAPFVEGEQIEVSISHCRTHVGIAVGNKGKVFGIDIERQREQIDKVKNRFLSEDSLLTWNKNSVSLLRAWTLMEAAYKAARVPGLDIRKDISMTLESGCEPDQDFAEGRCTIGGSDSYHFKSLLLQADLVMSVVWRVQNFDRM